MQEFSQRKQEMAQAMKFVMHQNSQNNSFGGQATKGIAADSSLEDVSFTESMQPTYPAFSYNPEEAQDSRIHHDNDWNQNMDQVREYNKKLAAQNYLNQCK